MSPPPFFSGLSFRFKLYLHGRKHERADAGGLVKHLIWRDVMPLKYYVQERCLASRLDQFFAVSSVLS